MQYVMINVFTTLKINKLKLATSSPPPYSTPSFIYVFALSLRPFNMFYMGNGIAYQDSRYSYCIIKTELPIQEFGYTIIK